MEDEAYTLEVIHYHINIEETSRNPKLLKLGLALGVGYLGLRFLDQGTVRDLKRIGTDLKEELKDLADEIRKQNPEDKPATEPPVQ